MSYKIRAIVVDQATHKVKGVDVVRVEYDFNEALKVVNFLENHRNDDKFGTFYNPLRYEAYSKVGIAAKF